MPDSSPTLNAHLADAMGWTLISERVSSRRFARCVGDFPPDRPQYLIDDSQGVLLRTSANVWSLWVPLADPVAFETVKREIAKRNLGAQYMIALAELLFGTYDRPYPPEAWRMFIAPLHVQCRAALSVLTAASRNPL